VWTHLDSRHRQVNERAFRHLRPLPTSGRMETDKHDWLPSRWRRSCLGTSREIHQRCRGEFWAPPVYRVLGIAVHSCPPCNRKQQAFNRVEPKIRKKSTGHKKIGQSPPRHWCCGGRRQRGQGGTSPVGYSAPTRIREVILQETTAVLYTLPAFELTVSSVLVIAVWSQKNSTVSVRSLNEQTSPNTEWPVTAKTWFCNCRELQSSQGKWKSPGKVRTNYNQLLAILLKTKITRRF